MNFEKTVYIGIIVILAWLVYSNLKERNTELRIELSQQEQPYEDSLVKLLVELRTIKERTKVINNTYNNVKEAVNERINNPYLPTKTDSIECKDILVSLNNCDSLLNTQSKVSEELNKTNEDHINNLNNQLLQKENILDVKKKEIEFLEKNNGGLYFTMGTGGNREQFNNISLGLDYAFKKRPLLIGGSYNIVQKTYNVKVGIKPFK